jgi:hypothetical protein
MVQISSGGLSFVPVGAAGPAPGDIPLRRAAAQETRRAVREPDPSESDGGADAGANPIVDNGRRGEEIRAEADAARRKDEELRERAEVEEQRSSRFDVRV